MGNLSSLLIGETLEYSVEYYNRELKKYVTEIVLVKIDSLLIDINLGAYGYAGTYFLNNREIKENFIDYTIQGAKSLIGVNISFLNY